MKITRLSEQRETDKISTDEDSSSLRSVMNKIIGALTLSCTSKDGTTNTSLNRKENYTGSSTTSKIYLGSLLNNSETLDYYSYTIFAG